MTPTTIDQQKLERRVLQALHRGSTRAEVAKKFELTSDEVQDVVSRHKNQRRKLKRPERCPVCGGRKSDAPCQACLVLEQDKWQRVVAKILKDVQREVTCGS